MEDASDRPALKRRFLAEAPYIVGRLPELPRLIHQRLTASPPVSDTVMRELTEGARTQNRLLTLIALLLRSPRASCCGTSEGARPVTCFALT
jgi:ubiquinone biosynthesis protein